jgi:DNA-binding NtrC family response regulator
MLPAVKPRIRGTCASAPLSGDLKSARIGLLSATIFSHDEPSQWPNWPAWVAVLIRQPCTDREMPMAQPSPSPAGHPTDRLLGRSPAISALRAQIRHLATFDTVGSPHAPTVLLQGKTGTGKGLVARVIHDSGPRAQGPLIDVNGAAIPETLVEAELLGYEAGPFTDAKRAKPGLLEAASGGTMFLDEIEALPLALQSKFLQVIEEQWVRRLGAVRGQAVDVKIIAATTADLGGYAAAGRFRTDLYQRLAVVVVTLLPMRARAEDILLLAEHFLRRSAEAHGVRPKRLSRAAEAWLGRYRWPGNVRELSHLLERVTLLSREAIVSPSTLASLCLPQPLGADAGGEGAGVWRGRAAALAGAAAGGVWGSPDPGAAAAARGTGGPGAPASGGGRGPSRLSSAATGRALGGRAGGWAGSRTHPPAPRPRGDARLAGAIIGSDGAGGDFALARDGTTG